MNDNHFWTKTPLLHSRQLSKKLGCNIYLKLENLQPSQSFKYRGMSTFIQECYKRSGSSTHLYCPSGGNAGLACASVAAVLKLKCTVCIPLGNSREIVQVLTMAGAQVIEYGTRYSDSLIHIHELAESDPNGFFVPAYESPLLWKGHSSMVLEIQEQLKTKPKAIFCSVGGGGLLGGILVGTNQIGWSDVPIFTLETDKSSCFYHSFLMNRFADTYTPPDFVECIEDEEHKVKLAKVVPMSKATSLGASQPAAGVVRMALDRPGPVHCITIADEFAMKVALDFLELHKFLVELACATALSPAFDKSLFQACCADVKANDDVVFIVCGGVKIGLSEMAEYNDIVKEAGNSFRRAAIDGKVHIFS